MTPPCPYHFLRQKINAQMSIWELTIVRLIDMFEQPSLGLGPYVTIHFKQWYMRPLQDACQESDDDGAVWNWIGFPAWISNMNSNMNFQREFQHEFPAWISNMNFQHEFCEWSVRVRIKFD